MFWFRFRSGSGGARGVDGGSAADAAAAPAAATSSSLLPRRDHGGAHVACVLAVGSKRRRLRHHVKKVVGNRIDRCHILGFLEGSDGIASLVGVFFFFLSYGVNMKRELIVKAESEEKKKE